jgi:hypothetical protein
MKTKGALGRKSAFGNSDLGIRPQAEKETGPGLKEGRLLYQSVSPRPGGFGPRGSKNYTASYKNRNAYGKEIGPEA